jgi:polyisoprenoid-binding protein YceI
MTLQVKPTKGNTLTDYSAATGTWEIDASHTNLGFSARHAMVAKVRGSFTDFAGSIIIDSDQPDSSNAVVTVKTGSLTTSNDERDGHLKSDDFLNIEQFPELSFASTKIAHTDGNDFTLTGDLTIRGTTHPVSVEVSYIGVHTDPWGGTRIGFEGHTEISRKDFGLTWNVALEGGGVLVADKVKIELDVEAVKQ